MSEIAPAKCRIEVFRGPPYLLHDHFHKWSWLMGWGTYDISDGETLYMASGGDEPDYRMGLLGLNFNTGTYRYAQVRITQLSASGATLVLFIRRADTQVWVQAASWTTTGLKKDVNLQSAYNGVVDGIIFSLQSATGNKYARIDYIGITKQTLLEPILSSDVVDKHIITRPLLSQGISGAKLTLTNFNGENTDKIKPHDVIIIWLARATANLGDPAYKVFGGRIVNPTYRASSYGAHFIDLDCHGHEYELNNPPALLQKVYFATNGRTIIENSLALCSYVTNHLTPSKWFDNTGASGSTDDRINSIHDVEYDEVKLSTPIQEILDKASNPAGAKGFDGYFMPSGVMVGHLRNSLDFTSPISSIMPESYSKSEDVHRVKNKNIKVYGAKERSNPTDKDSWTEATTNWTSDGTLSANADAKLGSYSVQAVKTGASTIYMELTFAQMSALFRAGYKNLNHWIKFIHSGGVKPSNLQTYLLCPNYNNSRRAYQYDFPDNSVWGQTEEKKIGPNQNNEWEIVMSGNPNWENIQGIRFTVVFPSSGDLTMRIDALFFGGKHFEGSAEDTASQGSYGARTPEPEIDEALKSDADCLAKAQALRDFYKDPVVALQNVIVDGDHRYTPGDRQRIIVSNDSLDAYFRIIQVQHQIVGVTWDTILTLSNEPQFVQPTYVGGTPFGGYISIFKKIIRQRDVDVRRG